MKHLDLPEVSKLALLNKQWHKTLLGYPFTGLAGAKGQYALCRTLTRDQAHQVMHQTGKRITWPKGAKHLKVVTSRSETTTGKLHLGRGTFGVFCMGYALSDHRYVGVKITEGDPKIEAELNAQRALEGLPNVMRAIDCCRVVDSDGTLKLYQIMELAGLGGVDRLRPTVQALSDEKFLEQLHFHLAKGLLSGLAEMHHRGWYHLDMKPDNLVVNREGGVFLIDFGLSKHGAQSLIDVHTTEGDPYYISPERWLAHYYFVDRCDGEKIDAWAAGMTLLELLVPPHVLDPARAREGHLCSPHIINDLCASGGKGLEAYIDRQMSLIPELITPPPNTIWEVVQGLLAFDPEKRLSPREAIGLPWLNEMEQSSARFEGTPALLREMVQALPIEQHLSEAEQSIRALSPLDHPLPHFTNYVPRIELQSQLKQRLLEGAPFTACVGGPGAGKTQLITYLLHDSDIRECFGLRLWFRGSDQSTQIEIQFSILGQELGLTEESTPVKEVLPTVLRYLGAYRSKAQKPWLIIFDNADDHESLAPYLPSNGQILITSRSHGWSNEIAIGALTPDEGQFLVQKILQRHEPDADALCKLFAHIPLGIVQACAYIRTQNIALGDYLALFHRSSDALERSERLYGKDLPYSMLTLYRLTLDQLKGTGAPPLLFRLACLAPSDIGQSLMSHLGGEPGPLKLLVDYALVQETSSGVHSVHRLVQEMARKQAGAVAVTRALGEVMDALKQSYVKDPSLEEVHLNRQLLVHGEAVLALANEPSDQLRQPVASTMRWMIQEYVEVGAPHHGLQWMEPALRLTTEEWGKFSAERASILNVIGLALDNLGRPHEALTSHQAATTILEEIRADEHPDLATPLANMGAAKHSLGDFLGAKQFIERALAILRKSRQDDDPVLATALGNLGCEWRSLGNGDEAIRCHREALAIARRAYGEDHPAVALALGNLGSTLSDSGQVDEGEACLDRALTLNKEIYGDEHPRVATFWNNLGIAYHARGDSRRARECHESALTLALKIYDEEHPLVATCLSNLGTAWCSLGEHTRSKECHQRALRIETELFGEIHPAVATSLTNLGITLHARGAPKEAGVCHQRALAILKELYGSGHPDVAGVLNNLGTTLSDTGDFLWAKECHQQALEIERRVLGEDHPRVATSWNNLGKVHYDLGDLGEARKCSEQALQIACRHPALGPTHPSSLEYRHNLEATESTSQTDTGRPQPALDQALTGLVQACRSGSDQLAVNTLTSATFGRDLHDAEGNPLMCWMAQHEMQLTMMLLLQQEWNPNVSNTSGLYPIHYAASQSPLIVKMLLQFGAEKFVLTPNNSTPAMLARAKGNTLALRLLLPEEKSLSYRSQRSFEDSYKRFSSRYLLGRASDRGLDAPLEFAMHLGDKELAQAIIRNQDRRACVDQCIKRHGRSTLPLLKELDLLSTDTTLFVHTVAPSENGQLGEDAPLLPKSSSPEDSSCCSCTIA